VRQAPPRHSSTSKLHGTQLNSGQVIVAISAGGVVTLVNHTSSAAVGLPTLAGGTQTNANASVVIEQVGWLPAMPRFAREANIWPRRSRKAANWPGLRRGGRALKALAIGRTMPAMPSRSTEGRIGGNA
jgi:hypothetical protein